MLSEDQQEDWHRQNIQVYMRTIIGSDNVPLVCVGVCVRACCLRMASSVERRCGESTAMLQLQVRPDLLVLLILVGPACSGGPGGLSGPSGSDCPGGLAGFGSSGAGQPESLPQ